MYKLSEQSASKILSEMPDFSFLTGTYVFTVKEQFNISDDFYEVCDLVAISGVDKNTISILPYDELKTCESDEFMSYVNDEGSNLEISLKEFKRLFELSEVETSKVKSITNNIKRLKSQKESELDKIYYNPDNSELYLMVCLLSYSAAIIASMLVSSEFHNAIAAILTFVIGVAILALPITIFILAERRKYNKLDDKYQKLYDEMNEKRAKDMMYLKAS